MRARPSGSPGPRVDPVSRALFRPPPAELQRSSFCGGFRRPWPLPARPEIAIPSGAGGSRREVSSSERSCALPRVVTRGRTKKETLAEPFRGENGRLKYRREAEAGVLWPLGITRRGVSFQQTFRETTGGRRNLLRRTLQHRVAVRSSA